MAPPQLKWYRPTPQQIHQAREFRSAIGLADKGAAPFERLNLQDKSISPIHLELLFKVGIPIPDGAISPLDCVVALLKIAAEIEHALMVQYLYAADSLEPAEDDSQENYTVKVMRVAIQEMGHLATVQNLLLLSGGTEAIHMQRDTLRTASELNPIPFVLERISRSAIAKFVAAEMPAVIPSARVEQVAKLLKIAKKDSGAEPQRVGAIYSVLRWIFMPENEANNWLDLTTIAGVPADFHVTDADLSSAAIMDANEARIDEWNPDGLPDFILAMPRNCAEAVDAIDRISEQGEGWDAAQDSHFAEFLELADAFDAGLLKKLIIKISKSPTLKKGIGGEKGVDISDPYTRSWGEVFSLQYGLLSLSIYHSLVTRRSTDGTPGLREGLLELAFRGMRKIIGSVAAIMTKLPLIKGKPQLSGPPYDLDPSILQPGTAIELKARHIALLDRLAKLYVLIEAAPEFTLHPEHDIAITNLRNFDQRRLDLFT
jgi:hypothetical protein